MVPGRKRRIVDSETRTTTGSDGDNESRKRQKFVDSEIQTTQKTTTWLDIGSEDSSLIKLYLEKAGEMKNMAEIRRQSRRLLDVVGM
jgi:hypothetical protein